MKKSLLLIFLFFSAKLFSQCTPSVSITIYNGPVCPKNNFALIAAPVNGGSSPTFKWKLNGTELDTSFPTFTTPLLPNGYKYQNGDVITCTMTSSAACANPLTATTTYTISYFKAVYSTFLSVSPGATILQGSTALFTGNVQLPSPNVLAYGYVFYINGVMAPNDTYPGSSQTNSSIVNYQSNTLKNGDVIYVTTKANINGNPCGDVDTSNKITMSVTIVLPMVLSKFDVEPAGEKLLLNWETFTETNANYFNVQESEDGQSFTTVGKVAAVGNSSVLQAYNFTYLPTSTSSKTFYFRLQMVDKDEKYVYSPVKKADLLTYSQIVVSPNPARNVIHITGSNMKQVQLYDMSGKSLLVQPIYSTDASINVANLSRGMYLLQITKINDEVEVQKVVLQ